MYYPSHKHKLKLIQSYLKDMTRGRGQPKASCWGWRLAGSTGTLESGIFSCIFHPFDCQLDTRTHQCGVCPCFAFREEILKASVDLSAVPPVKGTFSDRTVSVFVFFPYLFLLIAFYGNHFIMLRLCAAENFLLYLLIYVATKR